MNSTLPVVSSLLTERADFAPKLGRCAQCGWLHFLPEPHHPQCPENEAPTRPVYRYSIYSDSLDFSYHHKNKS